MDVRDRWIGIKGVNSALFVGEGAGQGAVAGVIGVDEAVEVFQEGDIQ